MTISSKSKTTSIPISTAQTFAVGAMRGSAIEVWILAAKMADEFAALTEAGQSSQRSGPEASRKLAEMFRAIATNLKGRRSVQ